MTGSVLGLATGIGSLPFAEAGPALDMIFAHIPDIPHWPQLPGSGEQEGFIRQYLTPLLRRGLVKISSEGSTYFDTDAPQWLEELTAFYAEVLEQDDAADGFGFPESSAAGFYAFLEHLRTGGKGTARYIKGQLSGPVTIGLQVTDSLLQPSFYRDELRDVIVRSLALQVRWQVRKLSAFGLPVIIFIDDPSIYGYGQSTFVGLSRDAIQQSLLPLIDAGHSEGALVGVHACAGVDWSLLFELPFDIVNIDVYNYFTSLLVYTEQFNDYLARGGFLAAGLVPTSDDIGQESAASLLSRLDSYFGSLENRKVSSQLLKSQLLFTPSCGTGTLSVSQAERIYSILQEVSQIYRSR